MKTTTAADTFTRERQLTAAITPLVEAAIPGVQVLAVELLSPSRFCVYLDHPAGVDFALCERVTRLLDDYRADWTIDVSSPGPERPLRLPAHFGPVVGRTVQIRTATAVGGKTRFRGELVAVGDDAVSLSVNGATLAIPVEQIVRGNLIEEGRER